MREIVTIQVGGFANFIGSHFWNFQDELLGLAGDPNGNPIFKNQYLDTDVLYRTGETSQGILTYTPRVLSIDGPGSFGSVGACGTLYNDLSPMLFDVFTWTGNVSTHVSKPRKKSLLLQRLNGEDQEQLENKFLSGNGSEKNNPETKISDKEIVESLDYNVQYWTDFAKVHYHPQSLCELNGLWMGPQNFDTYGDGKDALLGTMHIDEMSERLRFFVEESDHIQGIKFIVDNAGGFSSVAAEFLENIADEYTNTPVVLYSATPSTCKKLKSLKEAIVRNLHDSVSFSKLSSYCKLIIPIGLPLLSRSKASAFLHLQDEKTYHCSAVYASSIHSISVPFRMEPLGPTSDSNQSYGAMNIHDLVQMLTCQARQNRVAILDVAMPLPSLIGKPFEQSLQPLTPEITEDVEDIQCLESLTIHGAFESGSNYASISQVKNSIQSAYNYASYNPMFSHLSISRFPLPIPLPFPSIFGHLVGPRGEILNGPLSIQNGKILGPKSRGSLDVHSIPMSSRLRSTNAILPFLENRLKNLLKFGTHRGALGAGVLKSWGLEKDELEDMCEGLFGMIKALEPDYGSSSDLD